MNNDVLLRRGSSKAKLVRSGLEYDPDDYLDRERPDLVLVTAEDLTSTVCHDEVHHHKRRFSSRDFKPNFGIQEIQSRNEGKDEDAQDSKIHQKWTMDQDQALRKCVKKHGARNWKKISNTLQEHFGIHRNEVQCMHRWNKVLRPGLVKGAWTCEDDKVVIEAVQAEGINNIKWSNVAAMLPGRIGKQCRERWFNHLDPSVKKTSWTEEEDEILFRAQQRIGNHWCQIAELLPGRSENSVKNRWNSSARKKWFESHNLVYTGKVRTPKAKKGSRMPRNNKSKKPSSHQVEMLTATTEEKHEEPQRISQRVTRTRQSGMPPEKLEFPLTIFSDDYNVKKELQMKNSFRMQQDQKGEMPNSSHHVHEMASLLDGMNVQCSRTGSLSTPCQNNISLDNGETLADVSTSTRGGQFHTNPNHGKDMFFSDTGINFSNDMSEHGFSRPVTHDEQLQGKLGIPALAWQIVDDSVLGSEQSRSSLPDLEVPAAWNDSELPNNVIAGGAGISQNNVGWQIEPKTDWEPRSKERRDSALDRMLSDSMQCSQFTVEHSAPETAGQDKPGGPVNNIQQGNTNTADIMSPISVSNQKDTESETDDQHVSDEDAEYTDEPKTERGEIELMNSSTAANMELFPDIFTRLPDEFLLPPN